MHIIKSLDASPGGWVVSGAVAGARGDNNLNKGNDIAYEYMRGVIYRRGARLVDDHYWVYMHVIIKTAHTTKFSMAFPMTRTRGLIFAT